MRGSGSQTAHEIWLSVPESASVAHLQRVIRHPPSVYSGRVLGRRAWPLRALEPAGKPAVTGPEGARAAASAAQQPRDDPGRGERATRDSRLCFSDGGARVSVPPLSPRARMRAVMARGRVPLTLSLPLPPRVCAGGAGRWRRQAQALSNNLRSWMFCMRSVALS